ncbi:glycosyltransferase [Paenibacillaceae bacterium]|nr:glycosyltransferase [Paenibacillaceae bacterium]
MKQLSLCIVATANDRNLERCLESARKAVDEIILINTEPTIRIREIGERFGATVYDYDQGGSLIEAYNLALAKANGDWILWMHADEQVDETDSLRLRDMLYKEHCDLIFLHVVEYSLNGAGRTRILDLAYPRLIRNFAGFKFIGKHTYELLNYDMLTRYGKNDRVAIAPIRIYDYRKENYPAGNRYNALRELELLERELRTAVEENPWLAYHFACEYYRLQVYSPGFRLLNSVIRHYLDKDKIPPAIVYKLKYAVVLDDVYTEEVIRGLQVAVRMYPEYVDLQFYSGVAQFRKKQYEEAIYYFARCIELGEQSKEYLIRKGAGSHQAYFYNGLCMERLGRMEEAAASYIKSVELSSGYNPPVEALSRIAGSSLVDIPYLVNEDSDVEWTELQSLMEKQKSEPEKNLSKN